MRSKTLIPTSLSTLLLLTSCASPPQGPTTAVMPGPHKSFAAFQQDQAMCKSFAANEVAGSAQSANNTQVGISILGTLLGAGAGAAFGGGRGAAIGAGAGLLGGAALGGGHASAAQGSAQDRYDIAYGQCMYTRGNQVPVRQAWR